MRGETSVVYKATQLWCFAPASQEGSILHPSALCSGRRRHAGQLPHCHVTFLFLPRYQLTGDVGELGSGKRETGARTLPQGARVPDRSGEGRPILPPGPRRGPSPAWMASPPPAAPLPRCGPPDRQGQSSVLHTFAATWSSSHCPLVMRQNYIPGGKRGHPVPSAPKHARCVSKQS